MESDPLSENIPETPNSPKWNWTAKLIVGLILAAIGLLLIVRFQNFIGPLLTSFIIAYLFHPIARVLNKRLHINWRLAVLIVYIFFLLVILGLITWGGVALIEQVQNLIKFISENLNKIPEFIDQIAATKLTIGPFEIDTPSLEWDRITSEIIGMIQPILGSAGSLVGKLLSGGANMVFWFLIIYLVSFFFTSESQSSQGSLLRLNMPGYKEDMDRMSKELSNIFSAFFRGQLIVVGISIAVFTIYLGAMGVNFYFGLALIAGLGRFVPYIGAWAGWISFGLVALLQGSNPFNLMAGWYTLIVVGIAVVIDSIMDNILTPKVMGNALKVPPAAILLAALIGAELLGLIGVILAAPVYASIQLIVRYVLAKMMDRNPWENLKYREPPKQPRWMKFFSKIFKKIGAWFKKQWKNVSAHNFTRNLKTKPARKSKQ